MARKASCASARVCHVSWHTYNTQVRVTAWFWMRHVTGRVVRLHAHVMSHCTHTIYVQESWHTANESCHRARRVSCTSACVCECAMEHMCTCSWHIFEWVTSQGTEGKLHVYLCVWTCHGIHIRVHVRGTYLSESCHRARRASCTSVCANASWNIRVNFRGTHLNDSGTILHKYVYIWVTAHLWTTSVAACGRMSFLVVEYFYMYMYVCICTYVYLCIYRDVYIYICMYIRLYIRCVTHRNEACHNISHLSFIQVTIFVCICMYYLYIYINIYVFVWISHLSYIQVTLF